MRLLALLFAFYFAVLGCLPCTDVEPGAEQAMTTAVIQATQHGCGSSQGGVDWCSPLCQCHCCAGFALPTAPVVAFAVQPAVQYSVRRFAAQPVPAVPTRAPVAPWQPPQGA
jgi:hypothetical protein